MFSESLEEEMTPVRTRTHARETVAIGDRVVTTVHGALHDNVATNGRRVRGVLTYTLIKIAFAFLWASRTVR